MEERWYNLILNTDSESVLKIVKRDLQNIEIDAKGIRKGIFDITFGESVLSIYIIDYEIKFVVLRDDSDTLSFFLTVNTTNLQLFSNSISRLSKRVRNNIQSQGRLVRIVNAYVRTHPTFAEMKYLASLCSPNMIKHHNLNTLEQKAYYVLEKGLISLEEIRKTADYSFNE